MNSILFPLLILSQLSLYSLSVKDSAGNVIYLSDYAGKKILLVNTAANSQYAGQYSELEQLYQTHKDSLVIIAFPSNSFGNQPDSNSAAIADSIRHQYNVHYIISSQIEVKGMNKDSVYRWLNGELTDDQHLTQEANGDFQRFLISSEGDLIGVFSSEITPLSSTLVSIIESPDH